MGYSEFVKDGNRAFLLEKIAEEFQASRINLAREVRRVYGGLTMGLLQKFQVECRDRIGRITS